MKRWDIFWITFAICETFFIVTALIKSSKEYAFFGFGRAGGFLLVIIFCLVVAFFITLGYGAWRLGGAVGDIINDKNNEIKKK